MNDTDRGGMTISSLLMMGLVFSLAIPEIAIFALGVLRGPLDQTAFTIALVVCVLVVLVGVLAVYYFVRRRIQERFLALVEVCRNFAGGDRAVRATVVGDDEFSMLCQSLNSLLDNQSFSSGGAPSAATGDAAALQAQIEKLLQEVSAVGDGDLRVQAEVTPDTLGVLADSFNYMIEELAKVVGRVQATAVQVTNATRRVLDRSAELAQASETQVKQIQQTTQAVEALAIFIQNVARNAQLSAEAAQDALRHASTGQEGVRQTIDGMMRIRENVQETAKKIKRLGERSNEIGEIVRIIEDIADQTNLLALNAAIQSAMAGEHGRGFAVVADEIRLLAERSTESTKRIETLVKSIQGDTFEAVVAMEDSTQEVVKGSQLADDAGRALNSIYSAVERQAQMIETIARAANEQVQVSESVAVAMGEISEITRQTNNGMQESAMSVSYLAELADQLRTSVSTFRLPEQANEMVDVFPSMQGVPALPGADNNQYFQQDMGANNNDWNSGFSSDFLSLPQPQEMANSGPQYTFSNQQDFVPQASFSNGGQFGEQQFGAQPGGFEQHFSGQQFGGQQFGAQPGGFEQHFSGQQFGSQPGFEQHFNGQQFGNQPASFGNPGGQFDQFASDFGGFDSQQSFNGQQHFEPMRDNGFNNPPVVPNGRMPQQNAGSQPGTPSGGIRPRIRPQNSTSYNQDQVPFPNNGHMGQ